MHIERPFCHKVLPLTYDDSLSYYEVLCKIIKRLNEFQSNTEDYIMDILKDMGLDDSIRFRNFYNVKDYGAKGDGVTDDRWGIQEALNAAYDAGGGIVFVPEGHYLTSKCIVIGHNCTLMGSGAGSIIELTDVTPYWGVCVVMVGNNDTCINLKLLYAEQPGLTAPITNGAAWGALGITSCDYYSAVNQRRDGAVTNVQNVVVADIYTEGWYSLQVEPIADARNILYKNIHAAGSIVSIQGGTSYNGYRGRVYDVTVDNVECDYFRILGGNYVNGVNITNLRTHYIYTNGNDVHFENFRADCTKVSDFDGAGTPINKQCCQFYNYQADEEIPIVRCSASNGTIIGRNSNVIERGLCVVVPSKYIFENLNVSGFTIRNISGAGGSDTIFIGCDANEDGITNSPTGTGISNNMGETFTETNNSWTSIYTDVAGSITFASGYEATGASIANSYIRKNGNLIYGSIVASKPDGNLVLGEQVCTLPFAPANDVYFVGSSVNVSEDNGAFCPAIFKLDTTGKITLHWNSRHTPSLYNGVMFSFCYSLVHHTSN